MYWHLIVILVYFLILLGINIHRSRKIKSHDDYMVAGRSLSIHVMVFTLIATWIGSGTFIAGAEYAFKAGFSSLWMPAGAWAGILVIYFLAAKIRTFGQYTVGDILHVRYGKFARLFGSIAIIIAFTTIVSYQYRAGGYILNIVTNGDISVATGQAISAFFIIIFTALAGMVSVAHTDLYNGILIVVACIVSAPFVIMNAGGLEQAHAVLPAGHFELFSSDFGEYPALKAFGFFFATLMLLMGEQSMYQKFYSAKKPGDARTAAGLWIIGTIVVEVVVVVIAIFAAVKFWGQDIDPASIVILAANNMVPAPVGLLLLAAAWAVLVSTGMNFLLSPTTNIMRDIVDKTFHKKLPEHRKIITQKILVLVLGICAFAMVFIPTVLNKPISVLKYAYFAYTLYGVSITPVLLAALSWKRATKAAGITSIVLGASLALFFEFIAPFATPGIIIDGDPWGIPSIFICLFFSVGSLVGVSLLTPKPEDVVLNEIFN
ncbi:MAG: sodium:solute symporter family protein [candidate division KSB1 bacterium]|nr:sodium:solute symporter family protein [candidate division KSB1 bacterium]